MFQHLLYLGKTTPSTSPTTPKPRVTSNAEQGIEKFGNLKERHPEKQADQKMKGIYNIVFSLAKHIDFDLGNPIALNLNL